VKAFATGAHLSRELIDTCDAKIATWHSLLPSVKKDPMRKDGKVDEVIYMAHMIAAMYANDCSVQDYN
jgi:hypothetical protein